MLCSFRSDLDESRDVTATLSPFDAVVIVNGRNEPDARHGAKPDELALRITRIRNWRYNMLLVHHGDSMRHM